ncbi:MAG: hypothetical protein RLZZ417_829 [Bacteroidota bacterium]|jgi:hypothetical protein
MANNQIMCINRNYWLTFLTITGLFISNSGQAQQTLSLGRNNYNQDKGILFQKESGVNARIYTNGFSFGYQIGKIVKYNLSQYYFAEFGELKDPIETRQQKNISLSGPRSTFRGFIFGKQNNFYPLRVGVGEKRFLSEKGKRKGLAMGVSYEGGATIGLLKPYYLILRHTGDNPGNFTSIRSEKYSLENANRFLNWDDIFGADKLTKGLDELGIIPGLHVKGSLHFDWGAYGEFIRSAEIGIMADGYIKDVPILADNEALGINNNQNIYLNLFVNLRLGKRK